MSAAAAYKADAEALARGAVINFLGNFGRVSRALSLMLIAWLFGADVLGLYVLAWATTDFLRRFVSFGQEPAVVYYLSWALNDGDHERGARVVGSSLIIVLVTGALGSLLLWSGMDFISYHVLTEPRLVTAFKAFALALPAVGIASVFIAATRAKKVMKYEVLARSFVEPFVLLVGTVFAWRMEAGLLGLAMAQTAAFWCSALACVFFYRSLYSLPLLGRALAQPTEIPRLLHYSTPVAAKDVLAQGVARIDLFLVGHFLSAATAGVYGMVLEVASLSKYVRQALEPIFGPLVVEQHHRAEQDRLRYTYRNATRWALLINLGFFGIAALVGSTILRVYGNEFAAGGTALAILVFGQVVNGAFGLSEMMLLMVGRPALMLGDMALLLGLIGALDYAFIQIWGLTGAAIGTAGATILVVLLQVLQVRVSAGVHPWRKALLKPVFACLGALFLAWILPLWQLPTAPESIIRAVLFAAFYLVFLRQLGLEPEERRFGQWIKTKLGWRLASAAVRR